MGFWILAAVAAVFIVIALGYALLAPAPGTAKASAEFDLDVYRDQLRELERDLARGVIDPAEAERTKLEISRRLLEADKDAQAQAQDARAPMAASGVALAVMTAILLGGGAWLYADMGAPGYVDMPLKVRKEMAETARESRPTQADVEATLPDWSGPDDTVPADYVKLVEQLRTAVARRPDDVQGLTLLAQHEAQLGNFRAAYAAQERLIATLGETAGDSDFAELAEMKIVAVNGYVSPEAEDALTKALRINRNNQIAQYYTGLMLAQTGRPDLAFRMWRTLLEASDPAAPWYAPVRAQIGELAAAAGVDYTPPAAPGAAPLPGPTADDVANAEDMTPAERQEMVRGMVETMMQRLAEEGGTAPEWARLISALGVLGDTERAQAIWGEAQSRFSVAPDQLAIIAKAAREAGLDVNAAAPALPGPSAEDIENAADMSDEDRAGMIQSMVTQLKERLATDGGTPQEWARLIQVSAVQGDMESAAQAFANGLAAYDGDEAAQGVIRTAAEVAGVAP